MTRCQAEAEAMVVEDVAVAVAEDMVMVEAKAVKAMEPQVTRACAVHSVQTSLTVAPGMQQTRCAHPGTRLASTSEPSVATTSPTN